jgi:FixJ family two-component response regulator
MKASPAKTPKVYVVDDDDAVRRALAALMESVGYECVSFGSAREYLDQFDPGQAGCLVLDIRMPEMTGLELQDVLRERGATIPIIFITGHGDVPMAVSAMKKGAFGFIQKPFRDQDLLDRVNHALRRDSYIREDQQRREDSARRWQTLTPREREVCHLVVGGLANKEIGEQLGLSERTVEIHRGRVMSKMGVRAVAQLVHKYALLPPSVWQSIQASPTPATDADEPLEE